MAIHRICNQDWAIGITWFAPVNWAQAGRERRKRRELLSQKLPSVGYAEMETPVGYQLGATTDTNDLGHQCAAALLAQAQQSVVLLEKLDDNLYWLCTIEDGAVFPAGDLVGTNDQIAERLTEIRSDIKGKNFPLYDKSRVFDIDDAIPSDFSDLVKGLSSGFDITCKQFKSKKIGGTTMYSLVGALVLSFAVGSWHYFSNASQSDKQQLLRKQASQQYLNQEKLALQQSLAQNPSALLATFADRIFNRPLRAGGWRTHSYEWRDDIIEVTWYRDHGSTTDIARHLRTSEYEFKENASAIIEKLPFPANMRVEDDSIESRLNDQSGRLQLLDILAALPGKWTLKSAQPYGKHYPATRSHLSGTSGKLHEMIETALRFRSLPVQISRIKVTLDDSFEWELEGSYFAKSE